MDCTNLMRESEALLEKLDEVFVRKNADPAYCSEAALSEAVLDNVRYYNEDRKEELVEIFYSILSMIRERVLKQDQLNPFCNPQIETAETARLPQIHMLMRSMMPLSWAMAEAWEIPELKDTADEYLQSYTESESVLVYDILKFLFEFFPEAGAGASRDEFMEYWKCLALERERIPPEPECAKELVRDYLMKKKNTLKK